MDGSMMHDRDGGPDHHPLRWCAPHLHWWGHYASYNTDRLKRVREAIDGPPAGAEAAWPVRYHITPNQQVLIARPAAGDYEAAARGLEGVSSRGP